MPGFLAIALVLVAAAVNVDARIVPYNCHSHMFLGSMVKPDQKGIALDDDTAVNCSGEMLNSWPHTSARYLPAEKVSSLRVFRAWAPEWPEAKRAQAWQELASYVKKNNIQVLLGTSITCFPDEDKQAWEWTKELIHLIGREHLIGLSIGNELELVHMFREWFKADDACLERLWDGNYTLDWFREVVTDFDAMGYADIPITSIFGGFALTGNTSTFLDAPMAQVNPFLSTVYSEYKDRFIFGFNLYPYFDPKLKLDKNTDDQCEGTLSSTLCWDAECNLPQQIAVARQKITKLTGNPNHRFWLTEVGWSTKYSQSLKSRMKKCKQFSTPKSALTFYKGFLSWNMSISKPSEPLVPPERAFWFSMRDSPQLGFLEHFGLVEKCNDAYCKEVEDVHALTIPEAPPGYVPEESQYSHRHP